MTKSITISTFLIIYFLFIGCNKQEINNEKIIEKETYLLDSVYTENSLDLNFDNKSHNTILEEISNLRNSVLLIDNKLKTINIVWQEPRIDNGDIGSLPLNIGEDFDLKFYPVQNLFFFNRVESKIYPYQNLENTSYTFKMPKVVLNQDDKIYFKTNYTVLTFGGIKTIEIECFYVKKENQ